MKEFVKLFEPGKIGTMKLKNRIILAPIGTAYSTPQGHMTEQELAVSVTRARGGAGLIYKTVWAFNPSFGPIFFPGHFDISDDLHIEDAIRLTKAVKAEGAKIAAFVSHPGAAIGTRRRDVKVIYGPSAIRDPISGLTPKELSKAEIKEFVEGFAEGTERAKKAGFDAVMFQAGHGYLVHQFLSPRKNRRTDEYGGSVANRARFCCEIIKRTKERVGKDYPIAVRLNGSDFIEGGITIDEAIQHAKLFAQAGADAIDVSSGPPEAHHWQFLTYNMRDGALVHLAAEIKKAVSIPVIAVAKISPALGERILEEGKADFVDFCRSLIADPDWPNKVREGRLADMRPCMYCNWCLVRDRIIATSGPRGFCAVNPTVGQEREYERQMQPVGSPKKVMVIGGGIAGMEAARTLAERGHNTSLYEKSGELGGQCNLAALCHAEPGRLVRYLKRGIKNAGVKVFLNQEVTQQMVKKIKPDAVIVAAGATPKGLDVFGGDNKNVVQAIDVLTGKAPVGQNVTILGGQLVGLDLAIYLAKRGKKVTVVDEHEFARGLHHAVKLSYWEEMINQGVYTYPNTGVDSITENGVNIIRDGELLFLKADTVVLAVGFNSENKLVSQLKGLVPEVYAVGDCIEPRDILAAINEASAMGRAV
ncbi:MAG: FAD-dependent oxidoreductase [Chloroflexota bacterium]